MKKKLAILIYGPTRQIQFINQLIPNMNNLKESEYDIFIILRETVKGSENRQGIKEKLFKENIIRKNQTNIFYLKLPPVDPNYIKEQLTCPTGPDPRESLWIGMFYGIFLGVQYIKSTGVKYDYVMKMRTDYIPEFYPWFKGYEKKYLRNNKKIIVDGTATLNWRYPDNQNLFWQGSLSDQFSFSNYKQFLDLWDFEGNFRKFWTGVPETTLFRSIFYKYNLDHMQSPRRNNTFLNKFFYWRENTSKLPMNILYPRILSEDLKRKIIKNLKNYKYNKKFYYLIKEKIKDNWKKKNEPIFSNSQKKLLNEI
jgi:hypothetical protein